MTHKLHLYFFLILPLMEHHLEYDAPEVLVFVLILRVRAVDEDQETAIAAVVAGDADGAHWESLASPSVEIAARLQTTRLITHGCMSYSPSSSSNSVNAASDHSPQHSWLHVVLSLLLTELT